MKEQTPENFPKGEMHFPNRVWEPTNRGWASRAATNSDHERRRKYANDRGYFYLRKGTAGGSGKKPSDSRSNAQRIIANMSAEEKRKIIEELRNEK